MSDKRDEWELEQMADPKKAERYEKYLREHAKRLRRLERESRGEQVPGDYDVGYKEDK